MNVNSVGEVSTINQHSLYMSELTLARSPMNVMNAVKPFARSPTSGSIRELTLERNPMSAVFVGRPSLRNQS